MKNFEWNTRQSWCTTFYVNKHSKNEKNYIAYAKSNKGLKAHIKKKFQEFFQDIKGGKLRKN